MDPQLKAKIDAAAEHLTLAIEDWSVAEGVLALLRERRDWKRLERAHRLLLRDLGKSKATEIGGIPREAREASLWRDLGGVYRDRLDDVESAVEALNMAWRLTKNPVDRFAIAELHERAGRFDEALGDLEKLVIAEPTSTQPYERMFEIAAHRGDVDRAWCTAAALVMLGGANDEVRAFYEDHAPRLLPARKGSLDDDDWKKLRDAEDDPLVAAVLRWAAPEAFAKEASLVLQNDKVGWASAALGVAGTNLSLAPGASLDVALVERLYRSARAGARRRFPEYAVADLTVPQLKAVFLAAVRSCGHDVPLQAGLEPAIAAATELLGRERSPESAKRLSDAARAFMVESGVVDLARWRRGAAKTLLRAGVLVAVDPCRLELLRDRDEVLGGARVALAAAFTASGAHATLRARLGIAHASAAAPPAQAAVAPAPVAAADPPSPTAPAPTAPRITPELVLRALVEPPQPPATVGALADALGIVLDDGAVLDDATVVVPRRSLEWVTKGTAHLAVRHTREAPVALRDRKVLAFSLVCHPRDAVEAALRARYGVAREIVGAKGDGYRVYGPWVYTARSAQLGWFADVPDWLRTPIDHDARAAALRALRDGVRKASTPAELAATLDTMPPGIVRRGDELAFVPAIPVKVLEREIGWSVIALHTGDAWTLARVPSANESGQTIALAFGTWTVTPRLAGAPTGGTLGSDDDLHVCEALDVVASIWVDALRTSAAKPAASAPRLSPGAAFLLALLPAWRVVNAVVKEDDARAAESDARLARTAIACGLALPPAPAKGPVGAWLAQIRELVKPHLAAPLLESAWQAGEIAREVAVATALAWHVGRERCTKPDDADLREHAAAHARAMKERAAALTVQFQATGLPLVVRHASAVARIIGCTSNLEPTTKGGCEQMTRLVGDVFSFLDEFARKLDVAPSAADQAINDRTAALEKLGATKIKLTNGAAEATIDAAVLLERGAELFAAAPLARLHVRNGKGRVGEIVRSPMLAELEALDLDDQGVTDDDLIALAGSAHVRGIVQLDLRYNPITARGIAALAASPHLRRLDMVNLDGNPADPVDRLEYYDETNTHRVPTDAGKALEAMYGPLKWLHPR